MSTKTSIEWTDQTWNPTTGCDRISAGCDNCYALTMAKRLKAMGQARYQADGDPRTSGPGFGVSIHPEALAEPFTWRKPRMVFVNSMSDLFHDAVSYDFVVDVFAVMFAARRHTFQLLTKRHGRMRSLLSNKGFADDVLDSAYARYGAEDAVWPLPNCWLGVSVEDQKWADIRIPPLLETPAAVRFISAEPLLGPVVLQDHWIGADPYRRDEPSLSWVIAGGESGPGARPMDVAWVRDLVKQCRGTPTAMFVKQLGAVWASDTFVGGRSVASQGDRKGGDWDFWSADLRAREFPAVTS